MVRRLVAMVAALALSLLMVAPAFADTLDVGPDGIDWNDAGKQGTEDECADVPITLEEGQVAWHFIVNQSSTNDATLTATFADATYNVTNMPPTQVSPDKDMAEHYTLHYYVYTNQTTLLSASSTGDGNLQLSHICAGSPPPEIPEAPATVLLFGAGAIGLLGFFALRQRRGAALV
jgi:hypothetical protein